jgi:DHA2 family multidrug resistance protein
VTPYDFATRNHPLFDSTSVAGLRAMDGVVTQQASMIAYNNDFKLLFILTLAMLPLVFLLRRAQGGAPAAAHAE